MHNPEYSEKVLNDEFPYVLEVTMAERVITPNVCMFNDENWETLNIQIDLPGVDKKDIQFNFLEDGFYIIAKSDEGTYKGAFALPAPVEYDKAIAEYDNGLLTVNVPYHAPAEKSTSLKID